MAELSEEWVDVSTAQDGGVMKKVLQEASDPDATSPESGSEVRAHYTGTLESDGSKFDSSRDRGQEFKFRIGQGQVIAAWDQGFASMKVGEKAILKCRSDYAYGDTGSPPKIPPKSTLLFDVHQSYLFFFHQFRQLPLRLSSDEPGLLGLFGSLPLMLIFVGSPPALLWSPAPPPADDCWWWSSPPSAAPAPSPPYDEEEDDEEEADEDDEEDEARAPSLGMRQVL